MICRKSPQLALHIPLPAILRALGVGRVGEKIQSTWELGEVRRAEEGEKESYISHVTCKDSACTYVHASTKWVQHVYVYMHTCARVPLSQNKRVVVVRAYVCACDIHAHVRMSVRYGTPPSLTVSTNSSLSCYLEHPDFFWLFSANSSLSCYLEK